MRTNQEIKVIRGVENMQENEVQGQFNKARKVRRISCGNITE